MAVLAAAPSPYAGQERPSIKALSATEQADLLDGKGMGLAKAAELNGYPGPAHVIELADKLALTPDQRARTERLFANVAARAKAVGHQVIDAERSLDDLFSSNTATSETLMAALSKISLLQMQLRGLHLEAHIEQVRILSPEQIANYQVLRGYAGSKTHAEHSHQHKH